MQVEGHNYLCLIAATSFRMENSSEKDSAWVDNIPWFENIFSNPIIFYAISGHLDLEDFKKLRCTCRTLNNKVLNSLKFRSNSVFVIGKESIEMGILHGYGDIVDVLKKFRLEVTKGDVDSPEEVGLLWELLETQAEYIDFARGFARKYSPDRDREGISPVERDYKYIQKYTTHGMLNGRPFENLQTLRLHKEFIDDLNFSECQILMDNLFKYPRELMLEGLDSVLAPERFTANLNFMAERCTNLKILTIKKLFYISDVPSLSKYLPSIDRLISSNKDALEQLFLDDACVWKSQHWSELTYPKLKECILRCFEHAQTAILFFLNKHQLLETLDVALLFSFPLSILQAIVCPARREVLKKLSFTSRAFIVGKMDFETNPWAYLTEMKCLKEIQVTQLRVIKQRSEPSIVSTCSLGRPAHLLYNLPPQVEKVALTGMNERNNAGAFKELTQPIIDSAKISFHSFDKLTELSFSNCTLLEENVQFVLATMTRLGKLEFTECDGVTDFSLIGMTRNPENQRDPSSTTVPIQRLIDLRTLKISLCNGITNNVLVYINHKVLTNLDLGGNQDMHFNQKVISAIVHRVPSLSKLYLRKQDVNLSEEDDVGDNLENLHCNTLDQIREHVATLSEKRCSVEFYKDFQFY